MSGWQSPIGPLPDGVKRILQKKDRARGRCQHATKPMWYRPKGGTCTLAARFLVDGIRLCGTHYRTDQQAKARKLCPHCGQKMPRTPHEEGVVE